MFFTWEHVDGLDCSASSTICSHNGLGMIEVCLGQTPTRQLRKQSVRFYICDHLPSTSPNLPRIHVLHQTNTWLQILLDFSRKSHDHTSSSSKSSLNAFHLSINERPIFDLASPLGKRFFSKRLRVAASREWDPHRPPLWIGRTAWVSQTLHIKNDYQSTVL